MRHTHYKIPAFTWLLLSLVLGLSGCQSESPVAPQTNYPPELSSIFSRHGGIDSWYSMATLEYTIPKDKGNETSIIDLHNRYTFIQQSHHDLGFDGENVWVLQKDTVQYKGNAEFSHNLMFYFFSMPFVLGDPGIHYSKATPLRHEGKTWPGVQISYESNVGASPKDQYILYYDPESYQMEWLAYTATFFSGKKSDRFNIIKYKNWQTVNGLLLPETIQWYEFSDGTLGSAKSPVRFVDVGLSKEAMPGSFFKAPSKAKIVNESRK